MGCVSKAESKTAVHEPKFSLPTGVFAGNAISYILFLGFIHPLRSYLDTTPPRKGTRIVGEIFTGVKYVIENPNIARIFVVLILVSFLLRPVSELLPAFVGEIFHGGAATLSILATAFGLGGVTGGLAMLRLSRERNIIEWLVFGMAIIFSIGVFLFAINSSLFIAIPAIALAGVASTISAIGMQSLVQLNCDPSLRGRILSLYQLVFRGITPLGTFVIGIVAHWFSLKLITALSAIIVALILLYYVCSNSSLKVEIVEEALTE